MDLAAGTPSSLGGAGGFQFSCSYSQEGIPPINPIRLGVFIPSKVELYGGNQLRLFFFRLLFLVEMDFILGRYSIPAVK